MPRHTLLTDALLEGAVVFLVVAGALTLTGAFLGTGFFTVAALVVLAGFLAVVVVVVLALGLAAVDLVVDDALGFEAGFGVTLAAGFFVVALVAVLEAGLGAGLLYKAHEYNYANDLRQQFTSLAVSDGLFLGASLTRPDGPIPTINIGGKN